MLVGKQHLRMTPWVPGGRAADHRTPPFKPTSSPWILALLWAFCNFSSSTALRDPAIAHIFRFHLKGGRTKPAETALPTSTGCQGPTGPSCAESKRL